MAKDAITYWNKINLNNNHKMPAIGLGTYRMRNFEVTHEVLDQALSSGYRLFDTGFIYGNECHLKVALRELLTKHGLNRDDIFVISKLNNSEMGDKGRVQSAYHRTLELLGLEYLDLFLVQCPSYSQLESTKKEKSKPKESTWTGLVDLYERGFVDGIGVSNYSEDRLKGLMNSRNYVTPALNQVELNPLKYDQSLIAFCEQNDIAVQAYHSLGGTESEGALMKLPQVISIAKELDATPAQVLLVWSLQKGCGVIPKSINTEHIRENYESNFKLSKEQMAILDGLSKPKEKPQKPRQYHSRKKNK